MDSRIQDAGSDVLKRDHDSVDDFEHLGHDGSPEDRPEQQQSLPPPPPPHPIDAPRVDDLLHIGESFQDSVPSALLDTEVKPVPATPPPSADFDKCTAMTQSSDPFQQPFNPTDPKLASMTFVETERTYRSQLPDDDNKDGDVDSNDHEEEKGNLQPPLLPTTSANTVQADNKVRSSEDPDTLFTDYEKWHERDSVNVDEDPKPSAKLSMPAPEKSPPLIHFLGSDSESARDDKINNVTNDDTRNVAKKTDPKRGNVEDPPMPPSSFRESQERPNWNICEIENLTAKPSSPSPPSTSPLPSQKSADSKHESIEIRHKTPKAKEPDRVSFRPQKKEQEIEIMAKQIFRDMFRDMGLDVWFNPERLNPKVAALIYWRDPKKSGIVFGAILGVLLSLAYFSLISVLAYISLLVLSGTILFRIYKTVLQAVQKTSDGHPFKDILDLDLTLPAEKVQEVTEVAVAHVNAAINELRRLFLVEDFVDSLKFGVLLWCLTYVGSWFNGMTLIIIGVVALFTLPKVYETNKEQIDQNLALVQAKINEITAKVKAAIPLGKKAEPVKEE